MQKPEHSNKVLGKEKSSLPFRQPATRKTKISQLQTEGSNSEFTRPDFSDLITEGKLITEDKLSTTPPSTTKSSNQITATKGDKMSSEADSTKEALALLLKKVEEQETKISFLMVQLETNAAKFEEQEKTNAAKFEEQEKTNAAKFEEQEKTNGRKFEEQEKTNGRKFEEQEKTNAAKFEEQKKTNVEQKKTITELNGRLNLVVCTFEPAIRYALFESYIYLFVRKECLKFDITEERQVGYIQHHLASFCRVVMNKLCRVYTKKLELKISISQDQTKLLVLRALQGLQEYIKNESKDMITSNMDAGERNVTVHDGYLMKCLVPDSDDIKKAVVKDPETFKPTEESVKRFRNGIEQNLLIMAGKDCPHKSVAQAIEAVSTAMKNKVTFPDNFYPENAKKNVIDEIEKLL